ncbi:hypothetical protein [Rothia aeria]|uniref:hypothetical protein n=1 Tax=Rothia aeria TaxID=172042 RepID=UPI0028E60593|nr:hypothetical protein [Rothia aeria]
MTVRTDGADWRDGATPEQVAAVEHLYRNHRSLPYISPERNLAAWLEEVGVSSSKLVPKWVLEPVADIELYGGYLFEVTTGDIILLWHISFDTFTTQSWFPEYFEYTYGIDAAFDLRMLVEAGFVEVESAADSLDLVTAPALRKALKDAGVNGLSGAKKADLMRLAREHLSPTQLEDVVPVRSYKLTTAGRTLLDTHPEVVAKHPKKG